MRATLNTSLEVKPKTTTVLKGMPLMTRTYFGLNLSPQTTLYRFHFSCSLWVANDIQSSWWKKYPSPYLVNQIRDPFYGAQKVYVLFSTYSAHTYPQIRESPMCASTVSTTVVHILQLNLLSHGAIPKKYPPVYYIPTTVYYYCSLVNSSTQTKTWLQSLEKVIEGP